MNNNEYFIKKFDISSRKSGFNSKDFDEFAEWKSKSIQTLTNLLGIDRLTPVDANPRLIEKTESDTHIREKVIIDTEEGVEMPFYILKPKYIKDNDKLPVIIAPHGHGFGGKEATAGAADNPDIIKAAQEYNASYGLKLVERGCIVFCPDARGMGERKDDKDNPLGWSCGELRNMATPLGLTVAGLWVYDLIRLVDFVCSYKNTDPSRIGCIGLSGGGMQTLYLSALDERIKATVVSGYFYGFKEALLEINWNCACNYVPHLWENFDIGDIGAMIAPRALAIETGDKDSLNGKSGVDNVIPQVNITRNAYKLLNSDNNLKHFIFSGGHRFDGSKSIDFLMENLLKE